MKHKSLVFVVWLTLSACGVPPTPTPLPPPATLALSPTFVPTSTPTALPPIATPTFTPIPPIQTPTVTPTILEVKRLHFDHPFIVLPEDAFQERLAQWRFLADPTDELEASKLTLSPPIEKLRLTRAEAEEDVNYLFVLFKHGYAGYGSFNQDGTFERARVALLKELVSRETVSSDWLKQQIGSHLAFLSDCHLNIAGNHFCEHADYWYWDGIDFFKEGDRFWYWGKGGKRWLEAVGIEPPGEYLKLALNRHGDPVYQLGILARNKPADFTLAVSLGDGTRDAVSGTWNRSPFTSDRTVYSRTTQEEITLVVNRRLSGDESALQRFVEDAENLRDESLFILDLRGNPGGDSSWASRWVRNLTNATPQTPYVSTELLTRTTVVGKLNKYQPGGSLSLERYNFYQSLLNQLEVGTRKRGWTTPALPRFTILRNPRQLVVVLIDGGVCSSAEWFIGYLKQLEHVVFVGENSMGCHPYGDTTSYRLPNSSLPVQLDNKLFLETDLRDTQGLGDMPDLWVPANQALPYTIAAINRGWLRPE